MPNYIVRWPNGDFSIVNAKNKEEAQMLLDETGTVDLQYITPLPKGLLLNFSLTDDGDIAMDDSQTFSDIFNELYPILSKFQEEEGDGEYDFPIDLPEEDRKAYTKEWKAQRAKVVKAERSRIAWEKKTRTSKWILDLAKQYGKA